MRRKNLKITASKKKSKQKKIVCERHQGKRRKKFFNKHSRLCCHYAATAPVVTLKCHFSYFLFFFLFPWFFPSLPFIFTSNKTFWLYKTVSLHDSKRGYNCWKIKDGVMWRRGRWEGRARRGEKEISLMMPFFFLLFLFRFFFFFFLFSKSHI